MPGSGIPGLTGSAVLACVVGKQTPGELSLRPLADGGGACGIGSFRGEPSAGSARSRALARDQAAARKTPRWCEPRRGSAEPNRRYQRWLSMECGPTSKEQGRRSATDGRQSRGLAKLWRGVRVGLHPGIGLFFFHLWLTGYPSAQLPKRTTDSPHCPTRSWRTSSGAAASLTLGGWRRSPLVAAAKPPRLHPNAPYPRGLASQPPRRCSQATAASPQRVEPPARYALTARDPFGTRLNGV